MTHITPEFKSQLEILINTHSIENMCNMPDFMLADYICGQLNGLATAINARDRWMGNHNTTIGQYAGDTMLHPGISQSTPSSSKEYVHGN